jgi:hypothetical protein
MESFLGNATMTIATATNSTDSSECIIHYHVAVCLLFMLGLQISEIPTEVSDFSLATLLFLLVAPRGLSLVYYYWLSWRS